MTITKEFEKRIIEGESEMLCRHAKGQPSTPIEVTEDNIKAVISLALARNGVRGYYVTRRVFYKDGKRIAAADLC